MKNNSFIFYSSFYESIKNLEDSDKLKIFEAICEYGIYGKKKKVATKMGSIMELIIPLMDATSKRYTAQVENAKRGGAPIGNSNAKKQSKTTQNNSTPEIENNLKQPQNNPSVEKKQPNETTQNNLNHNQNQNYNQNYNYNNQIKSNQDSKLNNICTSNEKNDEKGKDKINFFLDVLNAKLKDMPESLMSYQDSKRLLSIFKLISEKDAFTIQGKLYSSSNILESLVNLFVGTYEDIAERFYEIFAKIDNAVNIQNKFNYSVSALYNKSILVESNC